MSRHDSFFINFHPDSHLSLVFVGAVQAAEFKVVFFVNDPMKDDRCLSGPATRAGSCVSAKKKSALSPVYATFLASVRIGSRSAFDPA